MNILPIGSLLDEDAPLAGSDNINLSKLHRNGIPIASGIVVFPPEFKFQSLLEYYQINEREVFEQRLDILKKDVLKIPIPEDLQKVLKQKKINAHRLWEHLLEMWLNQIRSKLWREGLGQGINKALLAQTVFFTKKVTVSGRAYFDFDQKRTVIETHSGVLKKYEIEKLNELVKKANKILVLPHVYDWIVEKDLKFVKVLPFTQYPQHTDSSSHVAVSDRNTDTHLKPTPKSAVKIYLQMDKSFRISDEIDGCFIAGENFSDFDSKLLQVIESGSSFPKAPIIYRLSDVKDKENVRGALRLIHQGSLLSEEAEVIKFARGKKKLLHVAVGIPVVRSPEELSLVKEKLEQEGIKRGGSLQFWLEIATPENILNIESYIAQGIDGVILNVDEIASYIIGITSPEQEKIFSPSQIEGTLKVLAGSLKVIHQAKKPILSLGSLSLHTDMLYFLLKNGVWGLAVDYPHTLGIQEYLRLIERKIVHKNASFV